MDTSYAETDLLLCIPMSLVRSQSRGPVTQQSSVQKKLRQVKLSLLVFQHLLLQKYSWTPNLSFIVHFVSLISPWRKKNCRGWEQLAWTCTVTKIKNELSVFVLKKENVLILKGHSPRRLVTSSAKKNVETFVLKNCLHSLWLCRH